MAEFPYTAKPSSVPRFLRKIQAVRVPDKVTVKYIASIGFKSSNDRRLIPMLKALGFLDAPGVPSERCDPPLVLWTRS